MRRWPVWSRRPGRLTALIMFWGCVNIQSIYPLGTPGECEREVWHMMRNLGTKDGGFGAYFYPQPYHIKAPKENIKAFKRGLKKYGVYRKIPAAWWDAPTIDEQGGTWVDDSVPALPSIGIHPPHGEQRRPVGRLGMAGCDHRPPEQARPDAGPGGVGRPTPGGTHRP